MLQMDIHYSTRRPVSAAQFIDLLKTTTLGGRRPVDDPDRIQGMLDHADLTVSAWQDDALVGIARSVTDFHYCCYLSDLAVAGPLQRMGIGRTLIRRTLQALRPGVTLILLAAPQAADYYRKIGFTRHDRAWVLSDIDALGCPQS